MVCIFPIISFHISRSNHFITGNITYSLRKIILTVGDISYYVKPYSVRTGYVHGDRVIARITKRWEGGRMSEVEIISLVSRSRKPLLARVISKKWKYYFTVIPDQWNLEIPSLSLQWMNDMNCIFTIQFISDEQVKIISKFGSEDDIDIEERLILWLSWARTKFSEWVIRESEEIKKIASETSGGISEFLNKRTDFRDWYTLTIDWPDAKDIDDALSIRQEKNGDYLLAVHIADVAEYVRENCLLDQESLIRATSIYTPGKVIPMLPEILSNDLCSLHPWKMKLTLSCVMTIDSNWQVKHTEIVEGIIESQHRGVYDDIENRYKRLKLWKQSLNQDGFRELDNTIQLAFSLYFILEKRRRKEGKITFESTEISFDFDNKNLSESKEKVPLQIRKRERNDAHKLIEEFMVLANEEVAKWCNNNKIPFLSRVHGLPGNEQTEIIQWILQKSAIKEKKWTLEPTHIREFLESISDPIDLYRYSHLLLPKMAKANYSDIPFRHFGLALEFYSHFTSPIRRYPDLQLHRIIKEKICNTLTKERIVHYNNILKRIAKKCSEQERSAEDIERAISSLYICRYMNDKIGKGYQWQISWLAEFALFIELENGIETTLYLPRWKYNIDQIEGIIRTSSGKKIGTIGEIIQIKIKEVNMIDRRVIVEKI